MYYKQNIYNILIFLTLTLILGLNNLSNNAYSQASGGSTPGAVPQEWVSILNPFHNQNFGIDEEITVSGESSDNSEKDCNVAVIVNGVKPYQKAQPAGPSGTSDFSQWKFTLHENYTQLSEGQNKVTAKLTCASAPTRWFSVNVTGLPPAGTNSGQSVTTDSNSNSSISPFEGQDEGLLPGLRSSPDTITSAPPTTTTTTTPSTIPNLAPDSNDKGMYVTIRPEKDPVARGDSQSVTISVTDSNSKPVEDASIIGKLVYPGGNYEKDFSGSTDSAGRFLFTWTIGSNGKLGPLNVIVDVTSASFGSKSATETFDLIEPTGTSVLTKGFVQPISKPGLTNANSQDSPDTNFISAKDSAIANDKFDFVMAGDYGCDSDTRKTVNAMEEVNPNLILALGDLSEVKDPDCFFDLFSSIYNEEKLKVVLGEHDTDGTDIDDSSSRFSQYVKHFNLVEPFYSFDYKNIHFLAMSTGKSIFIPYDMDSAQYDFVKSDLSKAASDKNIDWIIVYGYRPFYSSPTLHIAAGALRDDYTPLFKRYGVDLVITAHNHNYQRTYPLEYNTDDPRNPIIKDSDSSNYQNPNGTFYITVGTAGGNLYDLLDQAPFVANQFKRSGFLNVDISPSERQLSASFRSTFDGTGEDKFTISKS